MYGFVRLYVLFGIAIYTIMALPQMKTAPQRCPVKNGNLLDVVLFVDSEEMCKMRCQTEEKCIFYFYYEEGPSEIVRKRQRLRALEDGDVVESGDTSSNSLLGSENLESQPSQCFLFTSCSRAVLEATVDCPMTKENTVKVEAFVSSAEECQMTCSGDPMCGYYKYFDKTDEKQPMMCYHVRNCAPREIVRTECPLEKNNYIDHFLFTQSNDVCKQKCEDHGECRYYYWYPIDYSPAPLYCYLFRSCLGGAEEERVGIVVGGRHPGHYFLGQKATSTDEVYGSAVCRKTVNKTEEMLKINRAGAVSGYFKGPKHSDNGDVLLCGGRIGDGEVMSDCVAYTPKTKAWRPLNNMLNPREEAACVVMRGNRMYIMGGLIDKEPSRNTEVLSSIDGSWEDGFSLPEARSRFCAVAIDQNTIAILGGEVDEEEGFPTDMKTYSLDQLQWEDQPSMLVGRKDHACALVTLGGEKGILVSGGVGEGDQLLDSVEFFSLGEEKVWRELSPLKVPRTEHGMATIAGLPTVVGGVSTTQFLQSVEVLDNSNNEDAPLGLEWRIAAHSMATPRYDFALSTVPITQVLGEDMMNKMDVCGMDEEGMGDMKVTFPEQAAEQLPQSNDESDQ